MGPWCCPSEALRVRRDSGNAAVKGRTQHATQQSTSRRAWAKPQPPVLGWGADRVGAGGSAGTRPSCNRERGRRDPCINRRGPLRLVGTGGCCSQSEAAFAKPLGRAVALNGLFRARHQATVATNHSRTIELINNDYLIAINDYLVAGMRCRKM